MALAPRSITAINSVLKQSEDERSGRCELSQMCWYTLTYLHGRWRGRTTACCERKTYRLCGPVLIPPISVSAP